MSDVDELLALHELATQLRAENAPVFEAVLGDAEIIKAVAIDMLRFDGIEWDRVGPHHRIRAYMLAEIAVTSFLQQVLRSAS